MSLDITVAICIDNGVNSLPVVLETLKSRLRLAKVNWKAIAVDTNSHDRTAEVVKTYQQNWLKGLPLKYSFKPHQGLGLARQYAIEVAQGHRIGFLDDDSWPARTGLNKFSNLTCNILMLIYIGVIFQLPTYLSRFQMWLYGNEYAATGAQGA